jgi:hypothetical protein
MNLFRKLALLCLALCGVLTIVYATPPSGTQNSETPGNSYYLYTKAFDVNDSGVVQIPARFKWSIETSWSGIDARGKNVPDSRVILRLYDPDHNFTAITAQMDLATAARLHSELGDIIVKKLQDPDFQHRRQLYSSDKIPKGRIVGVDENGVAIIEFEDATTPFN